MVIERCGRYAVCKYCINNPKDTKKCECKDHMQCRDCEMPRMVMLMDMVMGE